MKILVIGGAGFFGQKIAESLRRLPDTEIVIGRRQESKGENTLQIDLGNSPDFGKLTAFDYVINCAAVSDDQYKALISYCLKNGVTFIETTADFHSVKQLLAIKAEMQNELDEKENNGLFIFGAGIFPGVSNLLYKRHLENYTVSNSIDLNVRYKVLSGAGKGMCKLMIEALTMPCFWFEKFSLVSKDVPFASLQKKPFKSGNYPSLQISMPELLFINANTKIPEIKTFISFKPTFVSLIAYNVFNRIRYMGVFKKAFLKLSYANFRVVRGVFFKKSNTDICISCLGDGRDISGIWFNNAFLSAGLFLTAVITFCHDNHPDKGMFVVEDVFDLEPAVQKMVEISKGDLTYQYF